MFKYFNCRLIKYFGKWSSPGLILFIFRKNININGIQNQIIKVEDDHAYHFFFALYLLLGSNVLLFWLKSMYFRGTRTWNNCYEKCLWRSTKYHSSFKPPPYTNLLLLFTFNAVKWSPYIFIFYLFVVKEIISPAP